MEMLSNTSRHRLAWRTLGRLRVAGLAACLALAVAPTQLQAQYDEEPAVVARRIQLEPMLTAELQRIVNKQKRIEGQGKEVTVEAYFKMQPSGRARLIVNLSESYVPNDFGWDMEELQQGLDDAVYWLLKDDISYDGVEFLYGGKDVYYYFPEQRLELERSMEARKRASLKPASGAVVVAAGHGIYYHHGFKDWRLQRDPSNGITEDFITRDYANELSTWLTERSGITPLSPRASSATSHAPSGEVWWRMAARYNLEATYPDAPDMWHSLPDSTQGDRERREDIFSRPLFANHVNADTIFHLHTNASDSSTASGARVYIHKEKVADKALGDNVLCYMKELIRSQYPYENYAVESEVRLGNHGENRLANMSSIIVESGFHTNRSDAEALRDPVFRKAAMKGVEKGYRLHTQGVGCEPLKITKTPDTSGPMGTHIPMEVYFAGHPRFPVVANVRVLRCPGSGICSDSRMTYTEKVPSPLKTEFECAGSSDDPHTVLLRTTLTDADDVEAVSEHRVTCTTALSPPETTPGGSPGQSLTAGPI